jgi:ribosomal protein S18 acetylase RimI-like enzyme
MIRKATTDDIEAISILNKEALGYIDWAYDKKHIRNTLRSDYYYVYTIKGKIVATIKLYLEHNRIWINTISVHKDYRHQGIGTKLIKYTIKLAKDYCYDKIVLFTDTNAKHNKGFYEKLGFVAVERDKERKHMWVKFELEIR